MVKISSSKVVQEKADTIDVNPDIVKFGKFRVIIIYEDMTFKEHKIKLNDPFTINIKEKKYLVVAKCIIKGKNPTLIYYYNNPAPIMFEFTQSKITALSLYNEPEKLRSMTEEEKIILSKIFVDSESLHHLSSNTLIRGLYAETKMSTSKFIIIAIVVLVVVVAILHFTGVIDVTELLGIKKPV